MKARLGGSAGNDASAMQRREVSVDTLTDMSICNGRGPNLVDIDRAVMDQDSNCAFVVLAHGGFLGMFEDEVALPVERLTMRGQRLVVSGVSDQDIQQMQDWEQRLSNVSELHDDRTGMVNTPQ